jgi:hypothetical protein
MHASQPFITSSSCTTSPAVSLTAAGVAAVPSSCQVSCSSRRSTTSSRQVHVAEASTRVASHGSERADAKKRPCRVGSGCASSDSTAGLAVGRSDADTCGWRPRAVFAAVAHDDTTCPDAAAEATAIRPLSCEGGGCGVGCAGGDGCCGVFVWCLSGCSQPRQGLSAPRGAVSKSASKPTWETNRWSELRGICSESADEARLASKSPELVASRTDTSPCTSRVSRTSTTAATDEGSRGR